MWIPSLPRRYLVPHWAKFISPNCGAVASYRAQPIDTDVHLHYSNPRFQKIVRSPFPQTPSNNLALTSRNNSHKIRPHRRCKRACLSGGTNTVSFSWGGATWFAGKMHGTFIKHRNLQHFWTQTGSPNFRG